MTNLEQQLGMTPGQIDRYRKLLDALLLAFRQAATGKGRTRHAHDLPFDEQFILQGGRYWGYEAALFQAEKKIRETKTLVGLKGREAAIHELCGAINYAAAAIIILGEDPNPGQESPAVYAEGCRV